MRYITKIPPSVVRAVREITPPWGPLGYVVYKRTYARLRADLGRTEEWSDTVLRGVQALLDYGMIATEEDVHDLACYWQSLKTYPAGRGLWQLGTKTVERTGGDSLMNCWFVPLAGVDAFCFLFNELMLGGGVGFSVLSSDVYKLPPVYRNVSVTRHDNADVDFIVPDNREGWVQLLRHVLNAFFVTGRSFTWSGHCIRSKGAPIAGFGGIASGPEELAAGIAQIAQILRLREGRHVRPIDALDIANIIGSIVVAGNVRRSAEIALGHADDRAFLQAKRWDLHNLPSWRGMSNNTCVCGDTEELPAQFWDGYHGQGEPYGLFNLDLCRRMGRLADGEDYRRDELVAGLNPCGEQTLEPFEACCLLEMVLPNLADRYERHRAVELIHKVAKTIISLPFAHPATQAVVERNRRVGIGLTGVCQSRVDPEMLTELYRHLEACDRSYSREAKLRPSIKLTTVKPSGTASLLPGVTPGIHPAYARHYIRRVRFAVNDPLVEVCRRHGYSVEHAVGLDGRTDPNTAVVSFPVTTPPGTKLAHQMSAVDQLNLQCMLQRYWSDNAVSITVYYRKEELPEIRSWLKDNYRDNIKSCSFLLHSEHGFRQAPYEEIDAETYRRLSDGTRPICSAADADDAQELELSDSMECTTGACPVR